MGVVSISELLATIISVEGPGHFGKSEESYPTDAPAHTSASMLVDTPPTHY